jgi:hypothetical protein
MYQEQDPTEATRLILWEEQDLYLLAVAHAVKVRRQIKEGVEVIPGERKLARIYIEREQHLHEVAEIPERIVKDMAVTLRAFADSSEEDAREIARTISDTDYNSLSDIERLRLGELAEEMARQLEDPNYEAEVKELESQIELPPVEKNTGALSEQPAPNSEAEAA